tara:strand:- start:848 stop:1891 length:1044 start_codon:yes stop_codon:yes gene_type:complete
MFYNKKINYKYYESILEYLPNNSDCINTINFKNEPLINSIKNILNNQKNKNFIVSLSGGIDSIVLICIIKYLNYNVIGCHINYNNREETQKEQEFLENWCSYNNIKLYIKVIENIKRENSKRSDYELITKNMRFDFYKEIMEKENSNTILLGHHKDDIVENIFANVCRGKYILDLAVIKEKSVINDVTILRPLIDYYKSAIYDFAHNYQIPYFKDTTPKWSVRGKYRNYIYPLVEDTFSKNVKNNLLGLSKQSYEWNSLIMKEIIEPFMQNIKFNNNEVKFNVEKYKDYPLCFWNIIFMKIFYYYNKNCPSRKAINSFTELICNNCIIPISSVCTCNIKNFNVTIVF